MTTLLLPRPQRPEPQPDVTITLKTALTPEDIADLRAKLATLVKAAT